MNVIEQPFFFLLGAAKSGTTYLHGLLDQHPQICMSRPKEPFFFEAEFQRGVDFYIEKYFSHCQKERIKGESRHRNLYLPFVAERIYRTIRNPKFAVILRDPADRAFSHWWHWYAQGIEKLSFEDAIADNMERLKVGPYFNTNDEIDLYASTLNFRNGWSPYRSYIDSGYYHEQVMRYWQIFGKDSVKILFYEDLCENAQSATSDVITFLKLEDFAFFDHSKTNAAAKPRYEKIMKQAAKWDIRRAVPRSMRTRIKKVIANMDNLYERQRDKYYNEMRKELVSHYKPEINRLEVDTSRDLSEWKSP